MRNRLRKLSRRMASLQSMKIKCSQDTRAKWRDRFLEIARQVECGKAPRVLVIAAGLRHRPRISAAAGHRVRILAAHA